MSDLGELIEADLNKAISTVIAQHEGGFVTKWVALIETAGPDGQRGLWPCTSEGATPWDTGGMLRYALDLETAKTLRGDD
jgi:hypothetical protein